MGISIFFNSPGEVREVVPVAGQSELTDLWLPIVEKKGLDLIEVCVSGGLAVDDPEVYSQLLQQVSALLHETETREEPNQDPLSAIGRLKRFLKLIREHPPSSGSGLYIG